MVAGRFHFSVARYYSPDTTARSSVASNTILLGAAAVRGCQVAPRLALFGSPVRMKAATLFCITSESASRPGRFASLQPKDCRFRPKLPKRKARSPVCYAPYTTSHGAGSLFHLKSYAYSGTCGT